MDSVDTYFISGKYKDNSEYFEDGFLDFQDVSNRIDEMKKELTYWIVNVRLEDGLETSLVNYNNLKRIEALEKQRNVAWKEKAGKFIETGSYY